MKVKLYDNQQKKFVNINPLSDQAKKIYKYKIDKLNFSPSTILPPQLTYQKGRFREVKTAVNFKNVERITWDMINSIGSDEGKETYLKSIFAKYAGKTVEISKKYTSTSVGEIKRIVDTQIVEIPSSSFSTWWGNFSPFFWIDSDSFIFSDEYGNFDDPALNSQIVIVSGKKVNKKDVNQYFLDASVGHCVFNPMKVWAQDKFENAKSKSSQNRYRAVVNKIKKYEKIYKDGVPETELQAISDKLNVGIDIDLPSTVLKKDTQFVSIRPNRADTGKVFRYINTRLNHIETNEAVCKSDFTPMSRDDLECKKRDLEQAQEFFLYKTDHQGVRAIYTPKENFKLTEDEGYMKAVLQFQQDFELDNFKINFFDNPELSFFLEKSINCLSCMFLDELNPTRYEISTLAYCIQDNKFPTEEDLVVKYYDDSSFTPDEDIEAMKYCMKRKDLKHIDLSKAFTRGNECIKYQGYLGNITDFRKTDKIQGLGIYLIKNIVCNNELFNKLGILGEYYAYTSPELEYFTENGITFDIVLGAWGTSFDLDFPDYMYEKEDDIAHYCRWYGCLQRLTKKETYKFNCKDIQLAQLCAYRTKCDVSINEYDGSGFIQYEKQSAFWSPHIATFINSYCRITMIEQMKKIPSNQLIAVQVDGIYYVGDAPIDPLFRDKSERMTFKHIHENKYIKGGEISPNIKQIGEPKDFNRIEVHTGAGGCGKTHNNLTDKGVVAPYFVAPTYKLSRTKQQDYNIKTSVNALLLIDDPKRWRHINLYSTLIFDEVSMMGDDEKIKLINRFKHHKLIFCGDLGFQLPPVDPLSVEFKTDNLTVIEHKKNYRCKDKELKKILTVLRRLIKKEYNDPFYNFNIRDIVMKLGFTIYDKDNIEYTNDDFIICKTNRRKDQFTEKYKELPKYYITENTRDYSNGQIVKDTKPHGVNSEIRHGFTIHSVQGETAKHKLFIDLYKINCLRMLYTGISRAEYLNQIVLIE